MNRYEFKDGKSAKFWEIALEGDSFTVRYGKIGTDGQSSTKTFDDEAKAKKEADKVTKSKVKKGYALVGTVAAAKPAGGNSKLEQPLFDDPSNVEAWQVYGDWLQEQGDPRGELVGIECALVDKAGDADLTKRRDELLTANKAAWLGKELAEADNLEADPPIMKLEWKYGFIHSCVVRRSWDAEDGPAPAKMLRALLKLESFKFVNEIRLGLTDLEGEAEWKDELLALSKVGKLQSVRRMVVGEFDMEDSEISWTEIGNVGRLWPVLPNLEYMKVHGGSIELGTIKHDKLTELAIETGGLPDAAAKSIDAAQLPKLTKLNVWFGTDEYGLSASLKDVAGLLEGNGYPKLEHLGLQNADFQDGIAKAVCTAPIVKRLKTLDLSMGTMSDEGANAIVDAADHFKHLDKLNCDDNYISDDAASKLKVALGDIVSVEEQEDGADEDDRYVTVGE